MKLVALLLSCTFVQARKTFNRDAALAIEAEMREWSRENNDRPLQFIAGNANTGEELVLSVGRSAPTTMLSEDSIYRLASMTKIMGGVVAAIAFEEGVVAPSDPIAKYVPEFAAEAMVGVAQVNEATGQTEVVPVSRNITLFDLLGMKGGFSYGFYGAGPFASASYLPPGNAVWPGLWEAGFLNEGVVNGSAAWVSCRTKWPQIIQPGAGSFYGYDYDVLGMVLGKAYGMNPAELMRTKIWEPLGMDSAFMNFLNPGDPRIAKCLELYVVGPPSAAYSNPLYPGAQEPPELPPGIGKFESELPDSVFTEQNALAAGLDRQRVNVGEGMYPGVSGYGGEARMTLKDYSKFLRMIVRHGVSENGVRIMSEQTWQMFMKPTVDVGEGIAGLPMYPWPQPTTQGGEFSAESRWHWGYSSRYGDTTANAATGAPFWPYFNEASPTVGGWGGIFGTVYRFDAETGIFFVAGENVGGPGSWTAQAGRDFLETRYGRWIAQLAQGSAEAIPKKAADSTLRSAAKAAIWEEMHAWSTNHSNRPLQFVAGNANTGEEVTISVGDSKPGTLLSEDSIYRLASMTKIMGGVVAAIAFEEGIVAPSDPIAKYVPEFAAETMVGVAQVNEATGQTEIVPVSRNITLFDLLGMKGGFSYGFWGAGVASEGAPALQPPGDGVFPALWGQQCDAITTISGSLINASRFLECRPTIPLISQPGAGSFYGYDYDVLGMVLGKAYGMNPAELMRTKIWEPLGMDSAFMSFLNPGDRRLERVVDLYMVGPPASVFSNSPYPGASAPPELLPGQGKFESELPDSVFTEANRLAASLSRFKIDVREGDYPGVSGYGEGACMTLRDYAKFLSMVVRKGVGENGVRIVGEQMWKSMTSSTINRNEGLGGAGPQNQYYDSFGGFSLESNWKWGFAGRYGDTVSAGGVPHWPYFDEASPTVGGWSGYFGTTYRFDYETGFYFVGGENTNSNYGTTKGASDFLNEHYPRWMAMLGEGAAAPLPRKLPPGSQATLDTSFVTTAVKSDMEAWSSARNNRPLQFAAGNANTGEEVFVSVGNSKPGKLLAKDSILRLGALTKIMGGVVAAIAFEEGVVAPSDPVAKYVPEFAAEAMVGVAQVNEATGQTEVVPVSRNITLFDLLSMKGGFSYGFYGGGPMADMAAAPPGDALFPKFWQENCDALTTSKNGSLVTPEEYIACRRQFPLMFQPGEGPYDGYDYDILGLVLGRAYGMNPEVLMRTKIWEPLGMASAFMGFLNPGDSRIDQCVDLYVVGPPSAAYSNPLYPGAQEPPELPPGVGKFESELPASVFTEQNRLAATLSRYKVQVGNGAYPGVSGYSDGAMMTMQDYGKFLTAVLRRGVGANGKRILGEQSWKTLFAATNDAGSGLGMVGPQLKYSTVPGSRYRQQTMWRYGFGGKAGTQVSENGAPLWPLSADQNTRAGSWSGYFGTTAKFDADTGFWSVCGENSNVGSGWVGVADSGQAYCESMRGVWMSKVAKGSATAVTSGELMLLEYTMIALGAVVLVFVAGVYIKRKWRRKAYQSLSHYYSGS